MVRMIAIISFVAAANVASAVQTTLPGSYFSYMINKEQPGFDWFGEDSRIVGRNELFAGQMYAIDTTWAQTYTTIDNNDIDGFRVKIYDLSALNGDISTSGNLKFRLDHPQEYFAYGVFSIPDDCFALDILVSLDNQSWTLSELSKVSQHNGVSDYAFMGSEILAAGDHKFKWFVHHFDEHVIMATINLRGRSQVPEGEFGAVVIVALMAYYWVISRKEK